MALGRSAVASGLRPRSGSSGIRTPKQIDDGAKQFRLEGVAFRSPRDVANDDFQTTAARPEIYGGRSRELLRSVAADHALPFPSGFGGVGFGFLFDDFADALRDLPGIHIARQRKMDLIP